MNPIWRDRIATAIAAALAIWLTVGLAEGALALPMAAAAFAAGAIMLRLVRQRIDAMVVGFLLMGYIVGNRGFAQLMLVPGAPLLPGEMGLALAVACVALRCAGDKTVPWRKDALNYALLTWMMVGTARFAFDFPRFGFVALRDYATVYYAAFFFVTQQLCQDERARRFLVNGLLVASTCLPIVFALTEIFSGFFLQTLTLRGVPLIYYKGDLAPMFLGMGGILLFLGAPHRHRWWARALATGMILWIFTGENRSSMLGVLVALGWVAYSRFRAFALLQSGIMVLAFILLLGSAVFLENAWAERKTIGLTERALSVVDFSGRYAYRDEGSINKSDNIQFRWIWWRSVAEETLAEGPVLGKGFGYDLARGFLQAYNPDLGEDFTARSPHNIFVTALGRMGLIGFALLTWLYGILIVRTWRVVRNPASDATHVALWVAIWPIAISACLGVVLEGPMGAVVFWSLLGLASAYRSAPDPIESEGETMPAEPLSLDSKSQPAAPGHSVQALVRS